MSITATKATGSRAGGGDAAWLNAAGWCFVALGAAIRLRQFAAGRSLWLDEILLALNVESRGLEGLAGALEYDQVSPVGFLWTTELLTRVFGVNEYTLRAVSAVCGIAALPVFYVLAKRVAGAWGAVVGVALLAVSQSLVLYSAEFKHYEAEALAAAVLVWLAVRVLDERARRGRWVALAAAGVAAMFFTFAGVFVLAGVWVGIAVGLWRATQRPDQNQALAFWSDSPPSSAVPRSPYPALSPRDGGRGLLILGVLWGVAFLPVLWSQVARGRANEELHEYWRGGFMPMPPRSGGDLAWFVDAWYGLFDAVTGGTQVLVGDRIGMLLGPMFVLGLYVLWRQRRDVLVMAALPIVLVLVASAAQAYPFSGRLILFLTPGVLLTVAVAAEAVLRGLAGQSRGAAVVLMSAVLAFPVAEGLGRLVKAEAKEDWWGLFVRMEKAARPSDGVMLAGQSGPAWLFYAPRVGLTEVAQVAAVRREGELDGPATVAAMRARGRVWLLSRASGSGKVFERWGEIIGDAGRRAARIEAPGVVAVRYEFGE